MEFRGEVYAKHQEAPQESDNACFSLRPPLCLSLFISQSKDQRFWSRAKKRVNQSSTLPQAV